MHRRKLVLTTLLVIAAVSAPIAPAAAAPDRGQRPLRVLVTNDDGFDAPGIDAVAKALRRLPWARVFVVAPATNQTAAGSATTPPGTELTTRRTKTLSGIPATAVEGYPADTVIHALERGGLKQRPDVVISGINTTQNLGATGVTVSGTVGAARAAAQRGVPALAVSLGLRRDAIPLDYTSSAEAALRWLRQHRAALLPKKGKHVKVVLDNLNVPTCVTGALRGTVEVPLASLDTPGAGDLPNCESTLEHPTNDIEAFQNGFVTLSALPVPTR